MEEELKESVRLLLTTAGWKKSFELQPLRGAGNNRVYRVKGAGFEAFLKIYFRDSDDPRDRLDAEFGFCEFCWKNGIHWTPRPLAFDKPNGMGLYEFIQGSPLKPSELTEGDVRQALEFMVDLNQNKTTPQAQGLPKASEACFSLSQHFSIIQKRLEKLKQMGTSDPLQNKAFDFVRGELSPSWDRILALTREEASRLGLPLDDEIGLEERCLSPSDFGFHNALCERGGSLRFIDFEYAGWDDPAKVACDFFCQPKVPVPHAHFDTFLKHLLEGSSRREFHRGRINLLLPIYRIKWCCIMLNEFLPVGQRRRRFSETGEALENRKFSQLEKARTALKIAAGKAGL